MLDHNTGVFGLWGVSTWTAAGQLYYSMTPEAPTGPYDHVWNWYDGSGRRFMTHLATTTQRALDGANPDSTVGFRTYYVYDGNDVAFTLVRSSSSTTWRIQQRYVNTGLDENVAVRLWLNGTPTSLALVTDRQGGYIMGVKANGLEETSTGFYLRNAFGKMESGSTAASSMETHTGLGFAGAGTPTSAGGGYVYMRNRWYDPQTGRFLSQDPIGLAGGVNLYAYAGNNPASFSDPFGLFDVEYLDAQSKGYVDLMRAMSKKFDKAMTKLENDHSVLVMFGQGNTGLTGCGTVRRTGGCTRVMITPRKGFKREFRVVLDPTGLQQDKAADTTNYFDMQTVVAHEAYAHVVPGASGTVCNDAASGTPANKVCSVRRENEIRKDAGLPLRSKY